MNNLLSMTIILLFLSAWITSMIGLDPIIGSFMIGIIIPRDSHLYILCIHTFENFVHMLLLPIYFALSGYIYILYNILSYSISKIINIKIIIIYLSIYLSNNKKVYKQISQV